MKQTKTFLIAAAALLLISGFSLSQDKPVTDDSDLASPIRTILVAPSDIRPDSTVRVADLKDQNRIALQFLYLRNGNLVPVSNLAFGNQVTNENGQIEMECQNQNSWSTRLETDKFNITSGGQSYLLKFEAACGGAYELKFEEASSNGQAISVFETFERGRRKLNEAVGLEFWTQKIKVVWPGQGDYYQWGTVHVTNGHHWDIVAHEMGHAIYDQGNLGQFGGGAHKIDECYSKSLALSEGWATFFGGWLYLDINDADAKFQYLVPRRSPIRIENVPDDVCRQITNEWRVSSFFWDIIDVNDDGETSAEAFAKTWKALENSNTSGIDTARARLDAQGFDKGLTDRAWSKNF